MMAIALAGQGVCVKQMVRSCARRWAHILLGTAIVLTAGLASAQTTSTLQGTIFDPSGAVVSGASVLVEHTATGTRRTIVTDVRGRYELAALATGAYRIEVRAPGLRGQILGSVILDGARTIVQDVHLTIGDVAEDVTVAAPISPIDRGSIAVGHAMTEQQVQSLPLNGRRFVDLGFLLPGSVTPTQGGYLTAPSRGDGFYAFNTAGNREDTVNVVVNGVSINEQFNDLPLQTSVTTIQELRVDNSTFSAQHGRNSGAIVNIVTRSGSNRLRGEAFEFFRHEDLDARNFFTRGSDPGLFRRHQFGAGVGGPVVRNQIFFFTTYEGQRQQQGLDINSLVLSDAERAAVQKPQVRELLRFIPPANAVDGRGTARFMGSTVTPFESDVASIDTTFTRGANRRLHGYYWHSRDVRAEPLLQGNTIPGFGDVRRRRRHVFTLNEMRVLSPGLVNEARVGFLRSTGLVSPSQRQNPAELGINVGVDEPLGLPQVSVAGGLNFGGPANFLMGRRGTTLSASDTLNYQRGRHSLRFGGDYRWYRNTSYVRDSGRINFPTVADFVAGVANAFSITLGNRPADVSQHMFGLFVQDQLGLRPDLTLELGLRSDWIMPASEGDGRFVVFEPDRAALVPGDTRAGGLYPLRMHLQPRGGIVWDPSRRGSVVVRAAYGVYTNVSITNMLTGATANPPQVLPLSYAGPVGLDNAILLARNGGLSPSTVAPDFVNASTQSWNVNVQRQVRPALAVLIGYFGARSADLRLSRNVNQPIDGVRPYPSLSADSPFLPGATLGNITQIESSGKSSYRGLWISSRGRLSDGLQLTASYTLSRSADYNSLNTQGVVLQNSYDLPADWGPSDYDARHRAAITAVYRLPFRGNTLVDGWQVSTVIQAQSGSPINVVTSSSALNGMANTVRPDVTGPIRTIGRIDQWFDTSVFAAANHFGNLPRNAVVGPRFDTTDVAIAKQTAIKGMRLELRAEVFNLFNHTNFGQPGNVVGSPNFGVITNTRFPTGELGSSREIQFGAKVTF
jgi:hypothetical protein